MKRRVDIGLIGHRFMGRPIATRSGGGLMAKADAMVATFPQHVREQYAESGSYI